MRNPFCRQRIHVSLKNDTPDRSVLKIAQTCQTASKHVEMIGNVMPAIADQSSRAIVSRAWPSRHCWWTLPWTKLIPCRFQAIALHQDCKPRGKCQCPTNISANGSLDETVLETTELWLEWFPPWCFLQFVCHFQFKLVVRVSCINHSFTLFVSVILMIFSLYFFPAYAWCPKHLQEGLEDSILESPRDFPWPADARGRLMRLDYIMLYPCVSQNPRIIQWWKETHTYG